MNDRVTRPASDTDAETRLHHPPAIYSIPVDIAPWLDTLAEARTPGHPSRAR
ncbi:hypothetical protein [Mycetocola tolaasinivorans]|uniref:hypothetical protein n=1 Tax=Mycetocola tolaasinivorans TaxID=76635 RepID=UPI00160339C2|nr:hypothetical protein [Mycetocola tolaasinivorans]